MRLSLSLNGKVTALAIAVLPILLLLGTWQLQRAEEKRAIQDSLEARQQEAPQPMATIDEQAESQTLAFRRVLLKGEFDNERIFLLDNRVRSGQVGFEILSPFRSSSGQWLLVNRGWVKGDPARRQLPSPPPVEGEVETEGLIHVPAGEPFMLGEQILSPGQWPQVVQAVEVEKFAALLDLPLFPYVLRLREAAPGALNADWPTIMVGPEKHVGYAVQWFAMSLALIIWFIVANTNVVALIKSRRKRGS